MSNGGKDGKPLPTMLVTEHGLLFYLSNVDQLMTVLSDLEIADLPVTAIGSTVRGRDLNQLSHYFISALRAMESGTELDSYKWDDHQMPPEARVTLRSESTQMSLSQIWSRPFVVTIDGQRRVVVLIESDVSSSDTMDLSYLLASTNIVETGSSGIERTLEGETIIVEERGENFGFIEEHDTGDDSGPETTTPERYTVVTRFILPDRKDHDWGKRIASPRFLDCVRQLLKHSLKKTKTVDHASLTCGQLADCLQRLVALSRQRQHPTRDEFRETLAARSGDALIKWAAQCGAKQYGERLLETESEAERREWDPRWRAEAMYQVFNQAGVAGAATVSLMEQANRAFNGVQQRQAQAVGQSTQQQEQLITEETEAQMSEEDFEAMVAKLEAERALMAGQREYRQAELDDLQAAMKKSDLEAGRTIKLAPCPVCEEQLCEMAFLPCWDGICRQCADENDDNVCPVCNQPTTGLEEL